jgi:hypothetical protein
MTARKNSKNQAGSPADQAKDDPRARLREEWDREAARNHLDENALRRKPDWLEAIGDENDEERVEANLRDEMSIRGEDDFVSDPTGAADMPTWADDDYDDEPSSH